jgi:hypothetical protein
MPVTALVHRALRFRDKSGDEQLWPLPFQQLISPRIASHPYFLAAIASGWVTSVQAHDETDASQVPQDSEAESAYQAEAEEERLDASRKANHARVSRNKH